MFVSPFWNKQLQVLIDSHESCVIADQVRYSPTGTRVSPCLDEVLSHVSPATWAEALGRNTRHSSSEHTPFRKCSSHSSWVPSSGLIDRLNAAFDKLAPAPIHHLALGADKTAPRVLIHDDFLRPDLYLEPVHYRLSEKTVSGPKNQPVSGPA